ncbi:hypothetical protein [Nocardia sp. CA-119907]|uniref:hypothetical protein n=1 Tax=Nocardia sp. CA-119907 TaxID=3239973 RepID=UPI003D99BE6F
MTRNLVYPTAASLIGESRVRVVLSDLQVELIEVLTAAEHGSTTTELAATTSLARTQPVVPALTSLRSRQLVDDSTNSESARVWTITELGRDIGDILSRSREEKLVNGTTCGNRIAAP